METHETSFSSLGELQNDTPRVRFNTIAELFRTINDVSYVSKDYLVVTDVSQDDYTRISDSRETPPPSVSRKSRHFRLRRYDAQAKILTIIIPTRLLEALHLLIYRQCEFQINKMGLSLRWAPIGGATFRSQGHPGGDGAEGDSTGGPRPERAAEGDWPTLVIDAGVSEPLADLRTDMRWWFTASDHQVKIVLLAKYDHTRSEILIEKWEEDLPVRPGATATRQSVISAPVLRQTITITQNTATDPVSYHATGSPLVLPFRLLFLRDPGPLEGDIIISLPELEDYASMAWP